MRHTLSTRFSLALLLALTALAALAAPGWAASVSGVYSGGAGTPADPWLIATADDLTQMREDVNGKVTAPSGRLCREGNYKLTRDIDLGGTPWTTCIGEYTYNSFGGNFDGGGHMIAGLNVQALMNNNNVAGLFGRVNGGTIRNLSVNGTVAVTYADPGGDVSAGGIVGYVNGGTIEDCSFTGTVTGTNTDDGSAYAGGIVGNVYNSSTVTRCAVIGAATSSSSNAYAGGIAGGMSVFNTTGGTPQITDCVAEAAVTATGTKNNYAGGIAGGVDNRAITQGNVYYGNAAHGIGGDARNSHNPSNDGAEPGRVVPSPLVLDFGSAAEGYAVPVARTVTIKNNMPNDAMLTLTQPANYTIASFPASLSANGTADFSVQPKANLAAGYYGETLHISCDVGGNAQTTHVSLKFTVLPLASMDVTVSGPDTLTVEQLQTTSADYAVSVTGGYSDWTTRTLGSSEYATTWSADVTPASPARQSSVRIFLLNPLLRDEVQQKSRIQ